MNTRRMLLLFAKEWDRPALARLAPRYGFEYAGFDPQRPSGMLQLPGFDPVRLARALARRHRQRGLAGILSNHEGYGALTAALLARELGLPGHDPAAVALAQHKYHCRQVLARVLPEAVPPFELVPARPDPDYLPSMGYPCFVKPVKANFSILARRVDDAASLRAHVRRPWPERLLLRLLVRPYERVCRLLLGLTPTSRRFIAEGLLQGRQLNVDGYAHRGRPHILGVVDELMYPGTQAFLRFDLPARLPAHVQRRAEAVAAEAVMAIGLSQGLFNVELTWDPQTDRLAIIEVNPRMATQFADLYRAVYGIDLYLLACALTCGEDPAEAPRLPPSAGAGASCVFRCFDGGGPDPESAVHINACITSALPHARVQLYFRPAWLRWLEYRWLGSHRYAVVNLTATDHATLHRDYTRLCQATGWPAIWGADPELAEGLASGLCSMETARCRALAGGRTVSDPSPRP